MQGSVTAAEGECHGIPLTWVGKSVCLAFPQKWYWAGQVPEDSLGSFLHWPWRCLLREWLGFLGTVKFQSQLGLLVGNERCQGAQGISGTWWLKSSIGGGGMTLFNLSIWASCPFL